MEAEEKLDFVFLDSSDRPWRVLKSEGLPIILYRWLETSARWCPFKEIEPHTANELLCYKPIMPKDEAGWYNQLSKQHGGPG